MTTTVLDLYQQLAVRINYPVTPTYRCLSKVIGFINILLSYINTPQYIERVELSGDPGHRTYIDENNNRITYLESGQPCILNPDGTINTNEQYGYIVHKHLFIDETGLGIAFVSNEHDVLVSDTYTQPILTALYTLFSGVSPDEAVAYINQACFKEVAGNNFNRIDVKNIKRRL